MKQNLGNQPARMARLVIDIYKATNDLTRDKEQEELEELTDLLYQSHKYVAAATLQLPLPDLKIISAIEVAELVEWRKEMLEDDDYNRHNIIKDTALKYQEIKEREYESTASTDLDDDKGNFPMSYEQYLDAITNKEKSHLKITIPASNPQKRKRDFHDDNVRKVSKTTDDLSNIPY